VLDLEYDWDMHSELLTTQRVRYPRHLYSTDDLDGFVIQHFITAAPPHEYALNLAICAELYLDLGRTLPAFLSGKAGIVAVFSNL